jgi:cellulose synthase/poly-beta-1,6-N-acetylglucosamine synthase-like glycosyltransferase
MTFTSDHCFVVPAYGESPHLEACLESLAAQTDHSPVVVATSTPNPHISGLARRYGAKVVENPVPGGGIGADWNFALESAPFRWVTLAHQDDIYLPDFAKRTLQALASHPGATLVFTDYREIEGTRQRPNSPLLQIKRLLLELAFLGSDHASSRFLKINSLRFGCAIPCPSATIDLNTGLRFDINLKVDLDWDAWLKLAQRGGTFVYLREPLMHHRVHPDSETTSAIEAGYRHREDTMMFRRLWPRPIADILSFAYRASYRSNQTFPS